MDYKKYFEQLIALNENRKNEFLEQKVFSHTRRNNAYVCWQKIVKYCFKIANSKKHTYGDNFRGLIVEIYINGHALAKSYFEQLQNKQSIIEQEMDDISLYWEKSPNDQKTFRIYSKKEVNINPNCSLRIFR